MLPEQETGLRVLDARNADERRLWERGWAEIAGGDPFSHPAYLEQFAEAGEIPCCALYGGAGGRVLYAFLRRPIEVDARGHAVEPGMWDIYTALLYGGPLTGGHDVDVLPAFWSAFRAWARRAGVVCEFIRANPVADALASYPGTVREQAPHIVRSLEVASVEELRTDMRSNVRRGVAKARSFGLEVVVDTTGELLEDFMRIYSETMDRDHAAARFRFPARLFIALHAAFPGRFAYVYSVLDGRPVSAELMLTAGDTGYFFLGGTETEALRLYASVLVHYEAIVLAWRRGLRQYVLTGGVTNTVDDSLLRFKRGFAPHGSARYLTGQQVFDEAGYRRLLGGADAPAGTTDYFPAYRAPRGGDDSAERPGAARSPESGHAPPERDSLARTGAS